MKEVNLLNFPNVSFGKNVVIKGDNVTIHDGVIIEDNVVIESKLISIGLNSKIEKDTVIRGLGAVMNKFVLGDNTFIGFRNQILVPDFTMLDYSQIHNSGLNSGYMPLSIGYNCWIGQGSILNSTEELRIDNNVRIGTGSQLWTHVASGELLEGCTLYGNNKLHLKDNVWIVGGAVISPGLVLEKNTIIMTGSVLTKSTRPYSTFAGVPAKDVTEKLSFWKSMNQDDKMSMLSKFINEFLELKPMYVGRIHLIDELSDSLLDNNKEDLFIVKKVDLSIYENSKYSIFDLETKKYTKTQSKLEVDWIKFNIGFRARFIPWI